jgi:hypothetical protein
MARSGADRDLHEIRHILAEAERRMEIFILTRAAAAPCAFLARLRRPVAVRPCVFVRPIV